MKTQEVTQWHLEKAIKTLPTDFVGSYSSELCALSLSNFMVGERTTSPVEENEFILALTTKVKIAALELAIL